ncbi:MAG: metal-sulfur cluster assembly factor [Gemmatimonadetes bacterium]|nr:metal-sulfur cluster assembly factor [Gemmatimonadota bacterium]
MVTEDQVREALKQVKDPEINLNVVDLGLLYEIRIEEPASVYLKMTLTSPMCPTGPAILNGAKQAVEALEGVERCDVELTWTPFWSPARMDPKVRAMLGL